MRRSPFLPTPALLPGRKVRLLPSPHFSAFQQPYGLKHKALCSPGPASGRRLIGEVKRGWQCDSRSALGASVYDSSERNACTQFEQVELTAVVRLWRPPVRQAQGRRRRQVITSANFPPQGGPSGRIEKTDAPGSRTGRDRKAAKVFVLRRIRKEEAKRPIGEHKARYP